MAAEWVGRRTVAPETLVCRVGLGEVADWEAKAWVDIGRFRHVFEQGWSVKKPLCK